MYGFVGSQHTHGQSMDALASLGLTLNIVVMDICFQGFDLLLYQ